MKTRLLIALHFIFISGFAQHSVSSFYPEENSAYLELVRSSPIDQSASGPDAVWDFNLLEFMGYAIDNNRVPTTSEALSYPGCNKVSETTRYIENAGVAAVYSKDDNNEVSITGIKNAMVELSFTADNATLGTFPLDYGYTHSDNFAGTYHYDTYNGTFSGTMTTAADAYGTIILDAGDPSPAQVTRLKTVLDIDLNYGLATNVGTIVQTIYAYYTVGTGTPFFRTSTTTVTVPALSIDQTYNEMRRFTQILGVGENVADTNAITMFPNPTHDMLYIGNQSTHPITHITVIDMYGRVVIDVKGGIDSVATWHLQKGVYTAIMQTDSTVSTQKIIKN